MTDAFDAGRLGSAPVPPSGEHFAEVARVHNVVIEEITSSTTPDLGEYRQGHDEWVVVLAGAADLQVGGALHSLASGDWMLLPASTPHRVLRTESGTRWLAVHVHPQRPHPESESR